MPFPLSILFAGAGEFGLPTLTAIREAGHEVAHVYSQPDRPSGRGRKLTPTAITQFALDHNLPVTRTDNLNIEPLPPADLLVVIAFGQKLSEQVANHPRLGAVNLHSSRLPKFRGAAPINWAILAGESETGNSVIRLANRMDAGAVLGMTRLPIGDTETAGELHDRLASDGAPLMLRVIDELANNTATETPQDESKATRALKLNREATKIDWSHPAEQIARQIRGMYPWPGCRVRLIDKAGTEHARLTLSRARSTSQAQPFRAGSESQILPDGTIQTGAAQLEIIEIQPEAKRPMPLNAYRNGHPWDAGMRLESLV